MGSVEVEVMTSPLAWSRAVLRVLWRIRQGECEGLLQAASVGDSPVRDPASKRRLRDARVCQEAHPPNWLSG